MSSSLQRAGKSRQQKLRQIPLLLTPLALFVCAGAHAAPGAGALGNQLRQQQALTPPAPVSAPLVLPEEESSRRAMAADNHTTVVLKKIQFSGLPAGIDGPDEAALQQTLADYLNRPQTFAGLEAMAQTVTSLYRQHGLLVARAILPPQTVKDGVLTIEVIPGHYDRAQIANSSALNDVLAQNLVESATPQGAVLTRKQLEREALLLNEIPGVTAQVSMKAGSRPGTTTPEITLTPGKRFGGYVGLDNQGDPTAGRSRVMAGGYVNNLLGLGDQLRVDLLDAYEKSDLFNGSVDYSLLAGGGYGTRIGVNYSHLNYRYNLNKLGFNGDSDNWGIYVTQPWVRSSSARVDARLEGGQQFLTDNYPDAFASGAQGRKTVSLGTLSVTGSIADAAGGLSGFGVSGTTGDVSLRSDTARQFAQQSGASGTFVRFDYQLNHSQPVWGPLSAYAGINGQLTSSNLDSSQKFIMGGPSAVRAYDIGDGTVDQGVVATVEIRSSWAIPVQRWLGTAPQLTVAAFYDQGWGQQYRDNNGTDGTSLASASAGNDNNLNLSGTGLYASVSDAGSYALTLTWAHRTGDADPNAVHDDHDRFWVSALKTF